jgi:hypothetical protein
MRALPMAVFALGCSGGGGGSGGARDGNAFASPWAEELLYRPAAVSSLEELDEALDTGEAAGTVHHAWTEVGDGGTRWWVSDVDDRTGAAYLDLRFDGAGLQLVAAPDTLATPIVLLPASFDDGQSVQSGDVTATITWIDSLNTWYGTFTHVVQVDLSGGSPTGQLRFAEGVGVIQFSVGVTSGDLAWYQ